MERFVVLLSAMGLLAGCQSQNPFAAFGPPTVPSPTTTQAIPYYPPTTAASNRTTASITAPSTRISVSAEDTTPPPPPRATNVANAADRETIRIVENPAAQTRTASAANRSPTTGSPPPANPAVPPALQPVPVNPLPNGTPVNSPQSKFVPSPPSPAALPRGFRADPAVAPASYQQPISAFSETPMANGQWRAR